MKLGLAILLLSVPACTTPEARPAASDASVPTAASAGPATSAPLTTVRLVGRTWRGDSARWRFELVSDGQRYVRRETSDDGLSCLLEARDKDFEGAKDHKDSRYGSRGGGGIGVRRARPLPLSGLWSEGVFVGARPSPTTARPDAYLEEEFVDPAANADLGGLLVPRLVRWTDGTIAAPQDPTYVYEVTAASRAVLSDAVMARVKARLNGADADLCGLLGP